MSSTWRIAPQRDECGQSVPGSSRISSRIQKVLEDANVKLASVATNVLGKSGRAMLEDIITGEDNPEHLASLALGRLRVTIPITTCSRRKDPFPSSLSASGVYWIKYSLWNTKLLCSKNAWRTSAETSRSCRKRWRWDTIPGVDRVALLAEVGDNVAKFPTAEQLASWDALCPGNHESAGKTFARCNSSRESMVAPHGWSMRLGCRANQEHLLVLAVQTLSARRGKKRAVIAVAHTS
jgi:transposase